MKYLIWVLVIPIAAVVIYALFLTICALLVNPRREYEKHSDFYRWVLDGLDGLAVKVCRIHIHVQGLEKIPGNTKKLLFVSNHRSNFDPIITWHVLKKWKPAFVSKADNFKIPLLGRMIRKCCFLAIDRQDPRKAMMTIQKAASILEKEQVSVGIYPEGTRSKSGELLPFHNGVFKIAKKAGAAVVVLGVYGTENVHRNFPFHATHVHLQVLDVIGAEEVAASRTAVLGDRAREEMEQWLSIEKEIIWQ